MINKAVWTAALALLGAGSIYAADVQVNANTTSDKPKVETSVKGDSRAEYRQEARIETPVKENNKASHIIGMEVRNRNDEKLGEIKDVVLDLQNGKVGYLVMGTGGGILGIGEKFLAIPANAFAASETRTKVLILDATKGDIVDAPGIASTNWPDPRKEGPDSPIFHPRNRGSAPEAQSGRAKLYTDANRPAGGARVEANVNHDNNSELKTMGRITMIDNPKGTITVETTKGRSEVFHVGGSKASGFKTGDRVDITYRNEDGKMIVDSLARQ
jgi:sporulation protein YlmC with PRC-barrel domain